ncbi:lysosomal acid phosphatase-like [Ylistrum balloti]|uniref:lysosomal acid phosphatase-like n=1 Tax=Ylistrum balloti TaxID=509963 RepID=UPI002905A8AF|nr:lysosomal acid phosphatase-like [Ylistrum balloti]
MALIYIKDSVLRSGTLQSLLTLIILQINLANGNDLVLVQAVFRHGDRSPTRSYPNDRHSDYWTQGLGQLTKRGMYQEYRLGKFFRQKYMDQNTFMSVNYNRSEIYIRSTDKDRTLMSAYCILAGMYPPINGSEEQWNPGLNWQPIPVHTEPLTEDHLLNADAPCPRYDELFAKFLASDFIAKFTARYQDLINKAAKLSGLPPTLIGLMTLVDPLFCEYTHGLNMSEWKTVLPFHPLLIQLLDYQNSYRFHTDEMAKLRGGPLLAELIGKMKTALNPVAEPSPKMYLYSAHDTTLVTLLRVMNVFNSRTPVYSSCVMVELWKPKGQGNPYVNVLYKNETNSNNLTVLHIPGCGKVCTLEHFINILKNNVSKDIHAECNSVLQQTSDVHVGVVVLSCLVALLVMVVTALIILLYRKRRTSMSYRPLATNDDEYT